MEGKHIAIIVLVLIVLAGGWYLLSGTPAQAPTETTQTETGEVLPPAPVESGSVVIYTDQGFAPPSITIPAGTSVTFINQSTKGMWVASAMHPSHSVYSGTTLAQHCPDTDNTAFDACAPVASGASYAFTFNKVGTWKYHDHIDASKFGTIIVTEAP